MISTPKPVNYLNTWNLAWPIILSNICIPLVGAANIAIVGHLSSEVYIGAVALGVMILQSIYWSFSFLRKGTTGLVAQAVGKSDFEEVFLVLIRALLVSIILGTFVTVLQPLISWIAFELVNASSEVEKLAKVYFDIRIWGTIPTMANYVFLGWFYGINKPKLAFVLRLAMNVLNIPLAIYLTLGLKMGVAGVALSAMLAHVFVFILSLFVVIFLFLKTKISFASIKARVFDYLELVKVFGINLDLFIRTLLVFVAFSWFTAASASRDDTLLAANTILLNMFWFISYTLDGFANSAEILVGQSYGSKDRSRLLKAIQITTQFSILFALLFTIVYFFAGEYIIDSFTHLTKVKNLALEFLPYLAFLPIFALWCFQLDGIYVGTTQTSAMMRMMIISFVVYSLAMLILPHYFGNSGLWLALYVFFVARAISLYLPWRGILKNFLI